MAPLPKHLHSLGYSASLTKKPAAPSRPRKTTMRPMRPFDPSQPSLVHDRLNDKTIAWRPSDYETNFREHAVYDHDGTVGWDGLILDGWYPEATQQDDRAG